MENFKIIKRDGSYQTFDEEKIAQAIIKAMIKTHNIDFNEANDIADDIREHFERIIEAVKDSHYYPSVYDIEKMVEYKLMDYDKNIAREYTGYRAHREYERQKNSMLVRKVKGLMNNTDPTITAENANKDANIISTQRDLLSGTVSKDLTIALHMLPKRVEENHLKGYIHFHDLDYSPFFPMYNCMLIALKKMLLNGFNMGHAEIETPNSFGVACTVTSQIITAVASNIYGGNTINRIDEVLAPYVTRSYIKRFIKEIKRWLERITIPDMGNSEFLDRISVIADKIYKNCINMEWYDEAINEVKINDTVTKTKSNPYCIRSLNESFINLCKKAGLKNEQYMEVIKYVSEDTEKEVYDGCQTLEYQINTMSSSNGQTPFTTFNFGLGTELECRLIQKSILLVRLAGLGSNKRTAIFPKLIFTLCKGINFRKGDPNYDLKKLAMKCSSKRLYPDVLSYEKICEITGGKVVYKEGTDCPDLNESTSFKAPMGCRSFLGYWINPETGKEEYDGRNNNGVISLNLVRIALETRNEKNHEEAFYKLLDEKLDVIKEGLLFRIRRLEHVKAKVAPILYGCGRTGATGFNLDPEEEIGKLFGKRTSISLGYVGLHECVLLLYGKEAFGNPEIIEKAKAIMKHLYDTTKKWSETTNYSFSVYGTPAESLAGRFESIDKKEFGVIEGINDKDWYTNSFHLCPTTEANAFEKIDFEANFVPYSTGGFTTMIDCNDLGKNPDALEPLWDYMYDKIGYMSINIKNDRCFECGYEGEFNPTDEGYCCPNCGNHDINKMSVIRRISGYLTDGRPINKYKLKEIQSRVVHY